MTCVNAGPYCKLAQPECIVCALAVLQCFYQDSLSCTFLYSTRIMIIQTTISLDEDYGKTQPVQHVSHAVLGPSLF